MSGAHSTLPAVSDKPAKPYPDFPLTAHLTGSWCKKIEGKTHDFGKGADPEGRCRTITISWLQQPDLTMLAEAERPPVMRALAKKPLERWPSCNAFIEALT